MEQALQAFATAVRDEAPVVKELERALARRLTDADATVILRQYLHLIEAAGRHEELEEADSEFLALVQKLSDLPYFNVFAQAVDNSASQVQAITAARGAGSTATQTAALTKPSCSSDCALAARWEYAKNTGLSVIGALFSSFDLVANGIACADQLTALYACLAQDKCGRVELASLGSSCLQVGGALAVVGSPPLLVGAVAITGALVGSLVARRSVDKQVASCQAWQEENCCSAKITCGSGCCEQGFACLPGGVCARNSTAGCQPDEKPCGLYCCAAGTRCDPDTAVCRPLPLCEFPTSACGTSCCTQDQTCDLQGRCQACPEPLCASTLCCQAGTFCSAVGQCLREPEGGCGPLCSVFCCPPGQSCAGAGLDATCVGEAVICPDGACDPELESPLVCPADCPTQCGDGTCQPWEIASTCASDCGDEGSGDAGSTTRPDGGTTPCSPVSDCGTWCSQLEAKALQSCEQEGWTVLSAFDRGRCLSTCQCMITGGCQGFLVCPFDPTCPDDCTCPDCTSPACQQLLHTCDWGAYLKCGRTS